MISIQRYFKWTPKNLAENLADAAASVVVDELYEETLPTYDDDYNPDPDPEECSHFVPSLAQNLTNERFLLDEEYSGMYQKSVLLFALKRIPEGTELTVDYGLMFGRES